MRITEIRYEPSSPERRHAFVQFGPSTSRSLNDFISNLEELDSVNLTQPMPGQSRLSLEHLREPPPYHQCWSWKARTSSHFAHEDNRIVFPTAAGHIMNLKMCDRESTFDSLFKGNFINWHCATPPSDQSSVLQKETHTY